MKKTFKIISLVAITLFIVYGVWYHNRTSDNQKVNLKNKDFIAKHVFSKDSENRGYSDEAKSLMDEDLKMVNSDKDIKKLYDLLEKTKRKLVLSKNKKEYVDNFILWSKYTRCIGNIKVEKYQNIRFKNLLKSKNGEEAKKMHNVSQYLASEYLNGSTFEETHNRMNAFPTKEECGGFLNE